MGFHPVILKASAQPDRAGCWSEGNTCHAELSNRLYSSGGEVMIIADGESWLLEASGRGEHWAVQVDKPGGGPFIEVCKAIAVAAHAEQQMKLGGTAYEWPTRAMSDGGVYNP